MKEQFAQSTALADNLGQIEGQVKGRLRGMLQDFLLMAAEEGLILRGRSKTFYAKQMAQQIVMESTNVPIKANNIEVA
jgi:hypothetical protein